MTQAPTPTRQAGGWVLSSIDCCALSPSLLPAPLLPTPNLPNITFSPKPPLFGPLSCGDPTMGPSSRQGDNEPAERTEEGGRHPPGRFANSLGHRAPIPGLKAPTSSCLPPTPSPQRPPACPHPNSPPRAQTQRAAQVQTGSRSQVRSRRPNREPTVRTIAEKASGSVSSHPLFSEPAVALQAWRSAGDEKVLLGEQATEIGGALNF